MKKSRKFWQDVDLAIGILMLRQRLNHIIMEGRNVSQSLPETDKDITPSRDRARVLSRYFEAMKEEKKTGIVKKPPTPERD